MAKKNIGSKLDDFLSEENILDDAEAIAVKRILAFQIKEAMRKTRISKVRMARRMKTSRSAVERLFDPENHSVTLVTLTRAASALGRKLKVKLV